MIFIGADPELFLAKDGKIVSAYGAIPGTKENPYPVENGAVQVDGMALEFNIEPADSEESFVHNIQSVMSSLKSMVEGDFAIQATAHFDKKYMKQQPEKATELGCSSDFNVYSYKENPAPDVEKSFRTAAGHIHIGWTEIDNEWASYHIDECVALTPYLDFYLGIPSVIMDQDKERRLLYGKAGTIRPKKYGFEYRVLSCFWLKSPEHIRWCYRNTMKALDCYIKGKEVPCDMQHMRSIINKSDVGEAKYLVEYYPELEVIHVGER